MPARYFIGQDGTILYAEVNPDYTRRPEPEDLLPAIRSAVVARSFPPQPGAAGAWSKRHPPRVPEMPRRGRLPRGAVPRKT